MSENRILWAAIAEYDKAEGRDLIIQRVIISPGKSLTDAELRLREEYPTCAFLGWFSTYQGRYNGDSDLRV